MSQSLSGHNFSRDFEFFLGLICVCARHFECPEALRDHKRTCPEILSIFKCLRPSKQTRCPQFV